MLSCIRVNSFGICALWLNKIPKRTAVSTTVETISRRVVYWKVFDKNIPLVLLKNVQGLGKTGDIVFVDRNYARNTLLPSGTALSGTWENIDNYARVRHKVIPRFSIQTASTDSESPSKQFNWIKNLVLLFSLDTSDETGLLKEPLTLWTVLQSLSELHHLDLLPENILRFSDATENIIESPITKPGLHDLIFDIPLREESVQYQITLNVMPTGRKL